MPSRHPGSRRLPITLWIEALGDPISEAYWAFVKDGGYIRRKHPSGHRNYFCYQEPLDDAYPHMLELFSRKPDDIEATDAVDLTPISADTDVSAPTALCWTKPTTTGR